MLHRAAVVLAHDDVLRDVHQPAREIPGVGGLQGRVRQALARAVGRREIFEDGEPLAEVRGDRGLDDLARRLRHEPAHAGELADLLLAAPGAGVGHHVDRVELPALLARLELAEHLLRDQLGDVRPDVDDLVVPLTVGDDAVLVLLLDLVDLLPGRGDVPLLGRRDVHVVDADGEARQGGVAEAEVLQLVQEVHGGLVAEHVHAAGDEGGDLLLLELLVQEAQRLRHHLVEERAAHGGLDDLALEAHADAHDGSQETDFLNCTPHQVALAFAAAQSDRLGPQGQGPDLAELGAGDRIARQDPLPIDLEWAARELRKEARRFIVVFVRELDDGRASGTGCQKLEVDRADAAADIQHARAGDATLGDAVDDDLACLIQPAPLVAARVFARLTLAEDFSVPRRAAGTHEAQSTIRACAFSLPKTRRSSAST